MHSHSAASIILMPLLAHALPLGLLAAGTAPQLVGVGARRAAALAAAMVTVLVATLAVSAARYPVGVASPPEVRSFALNYAHIFTDPAKVH